MRRVGSTGPYFSLQDLLSNPVIEDYVLTLEGGTVGDRVSASAAKLVKKGKA